MGVSLCQSYRTAAAADKMWVPPSSAAPQEHTDGRQRRRERDRAEQGSAGSRARARRSQGGLLRRRPRFAAKAADAVTDPAPARVHPRRPAHRGRMAAGIDFLTAAGHITDDRRQEFILLSDVLGASMQTIAVNNEAYGRRHRGHRVRPLLRRGRPRRSRSAATSPAAPPASRAGSRAPSPTPTATPSRTPGSRCGKPTRTASTTSSTPTSAPPAGPISSPTGRQLPVLGA